MGRALKKKVDVAQGDLFGGTGSIPDEPASASQKILVDADARQIINTQLDQNVVVLAGAGAGKTHELIGRMVASVAHGRASIEELAAITFTRKAAGEMKNRFASRLAAELGRVRTLESSDQSKLETVARLEKALANVDLCFIGTIHAFCARLLRERPLDAGLSPDFVELDEREESYTRREAWDAFVEHVFAESDPAITDFLDTGLAVEDLFSSFQNRVSFAEVPLKPANVNMPDLDAAVQVVKAFVDHVVDELPDYPDPDSATQTVRRAAVFIANRELETHQDQIDFLTIVHSGLSKNNAVVFKRWGAKDGFARKLKGDLIPPLLDFVDPVIRQWKEYVYSVAAPLLDKALDFFREYRRERSQVTFQDLMEYTVAMLKSHASVRRYFRRRIRTVFVDEFQDTDPLQAEMLLLLSSENVEEKDWRNCIPRPGTLFIVGDEKQSIYRFRRADIDIFRKVVEIVRNNGGVVVELTTSFRSLGNLCGEINRVYRKLFDNADSDYQASFAPLTAYQAAGEDDFCVRRLRSPRKTKKEDSAAGEAELVASFIQAAIEGKSEFNGVDGESLLGAQTSPGSFMLIARQRRRLSLYAAALERRGIPYDLTGGDSLGSLDELQMLVDFMDVLLAPDDPVKFFGYLRGPLIGLSDPELYAFRCAGGRFLHGVAEVSGELSTTVIEKVKQARTMLDSAQDDLKMLPAGAAIERIVDRLGLLAFAASKSDGSYRAGSLFRVLSFVRMWDADGMSWVQIVKQFKDLIKDDVKAIEGMTMNVGRKDVVQILNLHQAKGLEADVVFLVDAADRERSASNNDVHLSRVEGEPYVSITITKPVSFGSMVLGQPPLWDEDNNEEARYQLAEYTRLKYVAATRAAKLLVVGKADGSGRTTYMWDEMGDEMQDVPDLAIPHIDPPKLAFRHPEPLAIQVHERQAAASAARKPTYLIRQVSTHDEIFAGSGADETSDESAASSTEAVIVGDAPRSEVAETRGGGSGGSEEDEGVDTGFQFTRGGRGMQYGDIIHKIFEDVVKERFALGDQASTVQYFESQFEAFEGSPKSRLDATESARDAVTAFTKSDLFAQVRSSEEVYTEVPFASVGLVGDGGLESDIGVAMDTESLVDRVVTSGVIDLIYRIGETWHIVDYKTDGASTKDEVEILLNRYSSQVRTYAREWASIVDQSVESASLWIVARSEKVAVDLS